MNHETRISPDAIRQPTAADFERARADHAAGRGVDHIVVRQWLKTWGTPGRLDFPDWLAAQNG